MISFFRKRGKITSKSGIYVVREKSIYALNDLPLDGSINNIAKSLGYDEDNIHVVFMEDHDPIEWMIFEKYSTRPLFVNAREKAYSLSYNDVTKARSKIDWEFEWSLLKNS